MCVVTISLGGYQDRRQVTQPVLWLELKLMAARAVTICVTMRGRVAS